MGKRGGRGMKKKVIIAVTVVVLCAGIVLAALEIMESRQREAERIQKAEQWAQEMYGTWFYMGAMEKRAEPLTKEEIGRIESGEDVSVSTSVNVPGDIVISGRFSDKKIEDAYDAREVGCSVMEYLGISYAVDTFLDWEPDEMYPEYYFRQYYNGVRLNGSMSVWVKDGYACWVRIHTVPPEEINIPSSDPAFTKENVLAYLEEHYEGCKVYECGLTANAKKCTWEWEVSFLTKDSHDYYIEFDGTTGEILECFDQTGWY